MTATKTRKAPRKVSPAEAEKRAEKRELTIAQMKSSLDTKLAAIGEDSEWIELLDVIQSFGAKYSIGNQLLILAQAQAKGFTPTMVQSFNAWKKAGHFVGSGPGSALYIWGPVRRYLSKAECEARAAEGKKVPTREDGRSAQKVLVGYAPVPVFDISQLKDPEAAAHLVPAPIERRRRVMVRGGVAPSILQGDEDPTGVMAELETYAKVELGVSVEYVADVVLGSANGDTNGTRIRIKASNPLAQQVKTLVHEIGHNLAGHVGFQARAGIAREQMETEAESVAYVVCGALGFDTSDYSVGYVATWSHGDAEVLRAAGEAVVKASRTLLEALELVGEELAPEEDDEATQAA